jgi:hypothetical protein
MGRRPIGDRAMTAAERKRKSREKRFASSHNWKKTAGKVGVELLTMARIMNEQGHDAGVLTDLNDKFSAIAATAYDAMWPEITAPQPGPPGHRRAPAQKKSPANETGLNHA